MKKIVIIYTSMGSLIKTMQSLCKEKLPGVQIVNIADDSLITEVIQNGKVSASVRERMLHYFKAAASLKPDFIVSACSSVGAVAEEADSVLDVPVIRIDKAMIEAALNTSERIGVLASLSTTVEPTCDYICRLAKKRGQKVEIVPKVADGAYEANVAGNTELHDSLIMQAAREIKDSVDILILAQGSMARIEKTLSEQLEKPVFSSPDLCISSLAAAIEGE